MQRLLILCPLHLGKKGVGDLRVKETVLGHMSSSYSEMVHPDQYNGGFPTEDTHPHPQLAGVQKEFTNLVHCNDGAGFLSKSYLKATPDFLQQFPKNVKLRKTL